MKHVVIVDDQAEMTTLLERFYKKIDGINIKTFNDPQRAAAYITTREVDLVVTDITMPKMDGLELLQEIKALKPTLEVIMITAEASLERLLKSHKHNAYNFISKPINLFELEQISKKILSLQK